MQTPPNVLLSPAQHSSIAQSNGVVNIWEGAIRSGKTIGSLLRFLIAIAVCPAGGAIIVAGRTRDTIARNVLMPLTDPALFGPLARLTRYTMGASTASILGRTVYLFGANDAKAEPKIRGLTVILAYVDEITTLPQPFFVQLLGRMSSDDAQLFGTTNPDSPAHWFKTMFLDRALPGWRRFSFTMDDNPSLSQTYKDRMRREYVGLWFRRFILGEWVAAEGAVYEMWDPAKHVIPFADLPDMHRLLGVGVDYGTNNPSTALVLGLGIDRRLYLCDEWRYDPALAQGHRLTDAQQSARMKLWLRGQHLPEDTTLRPEWICVDPAAASFKVQLAADGVGPIIDAENDVLYGIRTVASLISTGQLLVSDRCTGFINEAPGYSWDDKASEKGEDKPIKAADHSLDGGRYAVATTETMWRGQLLDDLAA